MCRRFCGGVSAATMRAIDPPVVCPLVDKSQHTLGVSVADLRLAEAICQEVALIAFTLAEWKS